MKRIIETMVILLGTLGWWGYVYPELSLLEVPCEESEEFYDRLFYFDEKSGKEEDREKAPAEEKMSGLVIELPRIRGDGEQTTDTIRIKSKIAEYVYQIRNQKTAKEMQSDE